MKMRNFIKLGTSLLIGAAIGTAVGLLFAPIQGKKARQRIAKAAGQAGNAIERGMKMAVGA